MRQHRMNIIITSNYLIMQSKTTTISETRQLPAGISLDDNNIEFVGNISTKTVIFLQKGNTHRFCELDKKVYNDLKNLYLSDDVAIKVIPSAFNVLHDLKRQVEIYTYYMYGQLDNTPDVINGVLQPCENFRETMDCISIQFSNKYIDIEGVVLTARDLKIIDSFSLNNPDKAIAEDLGIAHSTFDFHKRNLFKKLHITTKTEAIVKAFKSKVICPEA